MIATDPNDTPETIEGFRQRANIAPLPWAVDENGEVSRAMDANALESTVILNREGEVTFRDATSTDYDTLQRELEAVL